MKDFFVRGVETSPLDHTFSADLLILVWPFLKAASRSLVCRAWLCSKVKATRQSGNRPRWGAGMDHRAVCAHIWPEKLIAPPPAVSSFTKWRLVSQSVRPLTALKLDHPDFPQALQQSPFLFMSPYIISLILVWKARPTLKSDSGKFCSPWYSKKNQKTKTSRDTS